MTIDWSSSSDAPADSVSDVCPDGSDRATYEVRSGDIPASIASSLDVTLEALEAVNPGLDANFFPGSTLRLPCEGETLGE